MPLATTQITGKIVDLTGTTGVRSTVTLTPVSTGGGVLPDAPNLRLGPQSWDTAADGSLSVTVPQLPQAGYEDWRWQVKIDPIAVGRATSSYTFSLTAATTWGAIAKTVVTGVPVTPTVLVQAQTAQAAAVAAAIRAEEAALDAWEAAAQAGTGGGGTGTMSNTAVAAYVSGTGATRDAVDARAAFVSMPKWRTGATYTAGQTILSPTGDPVSAKVDHTAGASFVEGNWNRLVDRIRGGYYEASDNGLSATGGLANAQADTAAMEALITKASALTASGFQLAGVIQVSATVSYHFGSLTPRSDVTIMETGWKPGQAWRSHGVRFQPVSATPENVADPKPWGIPVGGYMFETDEAISDFTILGIASHGGGTAATNAAPNPVNPKTGFLRLPSAKNVTLSGLYIENYGREAVQFGLGGIHRVSFSFFSGLFDLSYLTEQRGAFDIGGADHILAFNEFSGAAPGDQHRVTGPNLFAAAAWIRCGATVIDSCVFQVGDIGMLYEGVQCRILGPRFDHNPGHGSVFLDGTDVVIVAGHWNRNSRGANNTYDHLYVPPGGTARITVIGGMFHNAPAGTNNVRYHINDQLNATREFHNVYSMCEHGSGWQTGKVNIASRWTVHHSQESARGMLEASPSLTWGTAAVTLPAPDTLMPTKRTITLTGNPTLSVADGEPGFVYRILLELRQDTTGGRSITWAANPDILFQGGAPPTLNPVGGSTTVLSLTWLGDKWLVRTESAAAGSGGGGTTTIIQTTREFAGYGLAALGDSITSNVGNPKATFDGDTGVGCMLAGIQYRGSYASGGFTIEQVRDTHLPTVLALDPPPAAVRVMAGTNNMPTLNLANALAAYKEITDALVGAGIRPIICTIPPRTNVSWSGNIDLFNQTLRSLAAHEGLDLVDYHEVLTNPATGGFRPGYGRLDDVHPDVLGYRACADLLAATLRKRFPTVSAPLADSTTEAGNLLGATALFLTDTRTTGGETAGNGIADGFINTGSAGNVFTRVTDPSGYGHQVAQVPVGSAANVNLLSNQVTGLVGSVSAGEHVEFAVEITAQGFERNLIAPTTVGPGSTGPWWYIEVAYFNGTNWSSTLFRSYLMRCDVTDGVFWMRGVVPADATGDVRWLVATVGPPTVAPLVLDVTRPALKNLSRIGTRALEAAA